MCGIAGFILRDLQDQPADVLKKMADTYEKEVDRSLKTFISLLEPLMILVMGSIVAFIVVAMLLPIFQINFMIH